MRDQISTLLKNYKEKKAGILEFQVDNQTFIRRFTPHERLIILGGGHVGQKLSTFAAELGFSVVVVDDRPSFGNQALHPAADEIICEPFSQAIHKLHITGEDYVAVMTRGHRFDMSSLRTILALPEMPRYLGMMGSKKRTGGIYRMLLEEGFSKDRVDRIHMPIGLSISAETTSEIAVSILAELIQIRRTKPVLKENETILKVETIDDVFMTFLMKNTNPKAILVVLKTTGSTPVKAGAMMSVDSSLKCAGTIGGGCSEGIAIRKAVSIIGSGQSAGVTLDMDNDTATEAGMACGGEMEVLIVDIGQNFEAV